MEQDRNGTEKRHSMIEKTDPPRNQKFHGARRSRIDPQIMALIQHEAHKLRIFKIIMLLLIVSVLAGFVIG